MRMNLSTHPHELSNSSASVFIFIRIKVIAYIVELSKTVSTIKKKQSS